MSPPLHLDLPPSLELGLLWDFGVTKNGFLPTRVPLKELPDSYYQPWEVLIAVLPSLLREDTLRSKVDQLPVLFTDRLRKENEFRRAYLILTFLTQAYVWGGQAASQVSPQVQSVGH